MIAGIAHFAINTKDMEKTMDFYIRALGCKKAFSIPHPETKAPWIEYVQAGTQLLEFFYDATEENPFRKSLIGFNHLGLQVYDVYALVKRIEEAGYTMDTQPKEDREFNHKAWLKDPNGIRIELMQIDIRSPHGPYKIKE